MSWVDAYKNILSYVFSIETQQGSGTGFFFAYSENKTIAAFATAAHVVEYAEDWKSPLKLRQHITGKELFIKDSDRVILLDRRRDSASILITTGTFDLPEEPLPMISADKFVPVGTEIGWVGYPGIASPHLCFFTGKVSSFIADSDSYLIDGVAINGVSGGPVFAQLKDGKPQILGTASAYLPNRVRGDALPGLMSAQDASPFHDTIKAIRTIDEARRKKKEEEEKKAREQQAAELPPLDQST